MENLEFLRFAPHCGVRTRVCRPYRAKTKGKVERPIRYVRESFLYGRHFLNDAEVNAAVEHWLATVANVRIHATTRERPAERFSRDEAATLRPLPLHPYYSPALAPRASVPPRRPSTPSPSPVDVERRSLTTYAALTRGSGR